MIYKNSFAEHKNNAEKSKDFVIARQDGGVAIVDGGRHHQHSLAATVRRVIHAAVLILGIIADVVRFYGDRAAFLGATDNAFPENGIHQIWEKRHNVKSHISPLLPQSARE